MSYKSFSVGPANSQYQLSISGFTGVTTDPFAMHPLNVMKFTMKDRDNDKYGGKCAVRGDDINAGGWWHNRCSHIHVNHQYKHKFSIQLNRAWYSLPFIEVKIKLGTCSV